MLSSSWLCSQTACAPPNSQGRCLTQQRYYCQPNATTRVHSDVFGDYLLPNGCYFQVLVVRQHKPEQITHLPPSSQVASGCLVYRECCSRTNMSLHITLTTTCT